MGQSRTGKVGVLLIGQGLNAIVNFIALPYLARSLNYNDYGTYGQTILIIEIATALFSIGLGSSINIFLSEKKFSHSTILKNSLAIVFFLGVIGTLIAYSSAPLIGDLFENEKVNPFIKIYSLSIVFQLAAGLFNGLLLYFDKIKESVFLHIVANLIRVTLFVIVIQYFQSLSLLFYCAVFVSFFMSFGLYFFLPNSIKKKGEFSPKLIKALLRIGIPIGLTGLIIFLLRLSDSVMINIMLTTKDFAIYKNGAFVIPVVGTIFGSIAAILLPSLSNLYVKKDFAEIVRLKKKATTLTILLVYPIMMFAIIFHQDLVILAFSKKYAASGLVFMVFNIILITRVNNYFDIFVLVKNTSFILWVSISTFLLNLVVNFFLIQQIGIVGAAISTVLSGVIMSTILLAKGMKLVNSSFYAVYDLKKAVHILVVSTITGFAIFHAHKLVSSEISLIIAFIIFTSVIYLYILRFSLADKETVREILNQTKLINTRIGELITKIQNR